MTYKDAAKHNDAVQVDEEQAANDRAAAMSVCPQCDGEAQHCMYCNGIGEVTPNHAKEWHHQND